MDYSTPGLPVHHQLLEATQTHVHRVDDAIQPSHLLLSPFPPAFSHYRQVNGEAKGGGACRRESGRVEEAEIPAVALGSEISDIEHSIVTELVACVLLDEMERNSPNPVLSLCTDV